MIKMQTQNIVTFLHSPKRRLLVGTVLAIITASGLYYAFDSGANQPEASAMAATPVIVQTMNLQPLRVWSEFSGRLHAVDAAEIRPEVSGRIMEVRFEDGQEVKQGDVLFVIDPRSYEAASARAEASLASARTNANFAQVEQERAKAMVKSQAVAQRVFDERANANRVAIADLKAAEAELKSANLDLDHAYVKAPISGRVGRAEITAGNLVQAGPNAPLLTSVVANESIYADFEVDEQTYLQSIRAVASARDSERRIPVRLTLHGDTEHTYAGTIYSFDNQIDPSSGTIRARAKFDNKDGALIPGMSAAISLAGGADNKALLAPERALGFDQSKKYVYVVGKDNKVAYREVQLGQQVGGGRIVLSGLEPGERIIVDGMQHVRPEALVTATEATQKEADKSTPAKQ